MNLAKSFTFPGTKSLEFGVSFTSALWMVGPSVAFTSPYGVGLHLGPFSIVLVWLSSRDIAYRREIAAMFEEDEDVELDQGEPAEGARSSNPDGCGCIDVPGTIPAPKCDSVMPGTARDTYFGGTE